MRIRTIKPEFHQDEELSRVPRAVRLLAAALISWADDEGYFQSHPSLIAGSLFPFDEDAKEFVTDGLGKLAAIGFVDLFEGSIGFLPGFVRHQRINRATPSRLKPKALTRIQVSAHGGLTEPSHPEGKGTEGKGSGTEEEGSAQTTRASSSSSVSGKTPLQFDLAPPDPKTPLEAWTRQDFWRWAECKRREAGLPQERWPIESKLRDWWQEARPAADVVVLQETYLRFSDQPKWQQATPPLPFNAFMSLWNQYLPPRSS